MNFLFSSSHPTLFFKSFIVILILEKNIKVSCKKSSTSLASSEITSPSGKLTSGSGHDRNLVSAQYRAPHDGRDSESKLQKSILPQGALPYDDILPLKYSSSQDYISSKKRPSSGLNEAAWNNDQYSGFSTPNMAPSSYYPYNIYNGYKENPMLDGYPYYERDRVRELKARAIKGSLSSAPATLMSASASNNRDGYGWKSIYQGGYRSNEDDLAAMGSGDEGHGHGHGWGWKKEKLSKVSTDAMGLLGLLGLLSLLSNVLFLLTMISTTTAAGRRRKRTTGGNYEESMEDKRERLFNQILPHLTPLANARDGSLPVECILRGICITNKVLVQELQETGRPAAARMTSAIVKLLVKVKCSEGKKSDKKFELKKSLKTAALYGRNGKDCEKDYPVCDILKRKQEPALPFLIRMEDLPKLISKVRKLSKISMLEESMSL